MEDKLRALHARSLELETQLQVEARGRRSAEEANRELVTGAENARQSLRELQGKVRMKERDTFVRSSLSSLLLRLMLLPQTMTGGNATNCFSWKTCDAQ